MEKNPSRSPALKPTASTALWRLLLLGDLVEALFHSGRTLLGELLRHRVGAHGEALEGRAVK